jgi:hypothetical protein
MIIPVIGPSKAGKSTSTRRAASSVLGRVDLDELLGSSCRGDGQKAVTALRALSAIIEPDILVDVGAGQLVSDCFSSYLSSLEGYPLNVVVVWCDEFTFCKRHGDNAPNEVGRYYGERCPLLSFWESAKREGRFVDTSEPSTPAESAARLAEVVEEILRGARSAIRQL